MNKSTNGAAQNFDTFHFFPYRPDKKVYFFDVCYFWKRLKKSLKSFFQSSSYINNNYLA